MSEIRKPKIDINQPNYTLRRIGAGFVVIASLAGGGKIAIDGIERIKGPDVPPLEQDYVVQAGDTASGIASRYEEGNILPLQDAIYSQSNKDGNPGLQIGEHIKVPLDQKINK